MLMNTYSMRHCGILFVFSVVFDDDDKIIKVYPVSPMEGFKEPYREVTAEVLTDEWRRTKFFKDWCGELCDDLDATYTVEWINAYKELENAKKDEHPNVVRFKGGFA